MEYNSDCEETVEFTPQSTCHKLKHWKKSSETVSTIFYANEIYKPSDIFFFAQGKDICESLVPCRKLKKKKKPDLSERLISLKQISENKIKFMRLENELKELSACTFTPKINLVSKPSSQIFSQKQENYKKSKNSNMVKLKFQHAANTQTSTPLLIKPKTSKVHERLYQASRVFKKIEKYAKHHD